MPDLNNTIFLTLKALKDCQDVLVVAALVVKEIDVVVPPNAHVAKFVPFDLLLPHVNVLVTAGGCGAVLQALRLGVPIILAGVVQEKSHIVAWQLGRVLALI